MARPISCTALALVVASVGAATCPPEDFSTISNFDLDTFISAPWHIQQQMETTYLPKSRNRCVRAEYERKDKPSFWGYEITVRNFAQDVEPPFANSGATLCAKIVDPTNGKLTVAPCVIPTALGGPYWVIDYSEEEGYALISGGAPTIATEEGCKTGSGVNGAGLWIFTRQQKRDGKLVDKVRGIAKSKGYDLSVLNDVDQTGCDGDAQVVQI